MNNLSKIVTQHLLANSNNAIRVSVLKEKKMKLTKGSGSKHKFAFTLNDIAQRFSGVDNFLEKLPEKGFTGQVDFELVRVYEKQGKYTYNIVDKITQELPIMNNPTPGTVATSASSVNHSQHMAPPVLAGATIQGYNALAAPEMIGHLVESQRSSDHKRRAEDLEEKLKDLREQNRNLNREVFELKLDLKTIQKEHAIDIKKLEMEKTSFLDTKGGAAISETLGAALPKLMDMFSAKQGATTATLAAPEIEMSAIKKMAVQSIQADEFSDKQTELLLYVINNWEKDFIDSIVTLIKKRENA